jgi:hypothetical protein
MTQKFRLGGMHPQLQLVGTKSTIIDTPEKLEHLKNEFPFCHPIGCITTETVVTLDCEGAPSDLFFIQVATKEEAFFYDCVTLGATNVCTFLRPLFADKSVVKLMHDLHSCAAALKSVGNVLELQSKNWCNECYVGYSVNQECCSFYREIQSKLIICEARFDSTILATNS